MSKKWEEVAIEDVAQVVNGGTPKTKVSEFWGGKVNWITPAEMGSLKDPYLTESRRTLTDAGLKGSSASVVPTNSVILSTRAPIGHLVINTEPMAFNQGCRALVPGEKLNYKYLYYYLYSSVDRLNELGSGTTFIELPAGKLKSFRIPLTSLAEQKRIVAILDEAFAGIDAAIANTDKNLANARELFGSYLNSVFGKRRNEWRELTLKEICTDYGRGKSKHRPRNAPELYGGIYPFIQTGDVRRADHFIKKYSKTYNEKGLAQSKLWPSGTICITIAANIAETGVLEFDACFPDSLIGLVVDQTLASNSYVEFLLQSVKTVLKAKGKGSAQDNINLGTFEKEKFPFPPIEIQKKIVDDVQELRISIRRLESIYVRKRLALEDLKQSLLQKAFSGELTADVAEKQVDEAVA